MGATDEGAEEGNLRRMVGEMNFTVMKERKGNNKDKVKIKMKDE